ncbi:kinase-like domain-containing protein, partial [Lactarius hengduanensis]
LRKTSEKHYVPRKLDFVHVGGRYRVGRLLGSGGSGSVYLGKDIRMTAQVALKIGHVDRSPSGLTYEYDYVGMEKKAHMKLSFWSTLGPSLGDLLSAQQFDLRKTFLYAPQMLSAVESLHTQHYIHCDIKPGNFMVRPDNTIFLIDFGLAQLFRNPAMYLHISYSTDHSIVGTLPFMSINGQLGNAQLRCDDLESLAYTIICLAHGNLPWTTVPASSDQEAVLQKKLLTTAEELCEGLPASFCKFVTYVHSLGFNEKPDYQHLHSILSQCSQPDTVQTDNALPSVRSPFDVHHTPVSSDRV